MERPARLRLVSSNCVEHTWLSLTQCLMKTRKNVNNTETAGQCTNYSRRQSNDHHKRQTLTTGSARCRLLFVTQRQQTAVNHYTHTQTRRHTSDQYINNKYLLYQRRARGGCYCVSWTEQLEILSELSTFRVAAARRRRRHVTVMMTASRTVMTATQTTSETKIVDS